MLAKGFHLGGALIPRKRRFDELSNLSYGQPRKNPRALIDAYGSNKSQETSGSKPLLVERLDKNGTDKVTTTSWQNTEEEEFDWEDMSRTLVEHSRSNGLLQPTIDFSTEKPVTAAASPTIEYRPPVSPATFETRHSINVHDPRPPFQLPNQLPGLISSNTHNCGQTPPFQFFPSQDPAALQFTYRTSLPGNVAAMINPPPIPLPVMPLPLPGQRIGNNSFHFQGEVFRPLPPTGPHAQPQILPLPNPGPFVSSQEPTAGYSNLISSLLGQGVISLANPAPVQDFIGIEFDPNILKVRHESLISALYGDLPRQCTTCGLRFKSQDEHSSHMDWHVTKNRMSKNRKQKPSRKWFVSETMWLKCAEALGVKSAPGFLPTETTEEKKDDEEVAVPADEDQITCALCGEHFDEFYSDETEEWMYRGAVYINKQLGPIVHDKCKS